MKTHLLVLFALVAIVALGVAPPVQACDGYGYGYGYLYHALDYRVPYFAAHPPVYYSYPVPRTYGYSPFAYPPHVMTPEVVEPSATPIQILNPYVPSATPEKTQPEPDQTATNAGQPQPLVILNPFVTAQGSIAQIQ